MTFLDCRFSGRGQSTRASELLWLRQVFLLHVCDSCLVLNISLSVVRRDYQTPRPRTPGPLVRYELPPTGFVWLQRCLSHAMPSDNLLLTIFPSHLNGARRPLAELWIERKMLTSLASQTESLNESYEKGLKARVQNHCHRKKQWYHDKSAQQCTRMLATYQKLTGRHSSLSFCSNQD